MTPVQVLPPRHRVRKFISERGFVACCSSCGWSTCRRDRDVRDSDVKDHELEQEVDRG